VKELARTLSTSRNSRNFATRPRPSKQRDSLLAKERAVAKGLQEIDRTKPMADPQDRGLVKGSGGK